MRPSHLSNAPTAWLERLTPPAINDLLSEQVPGPVFRTFRLEVRKAVVAVRTWAQGGVLAVPAATEHQENVVRQVAEILKQEAQS